MSKRRNRLDYEALKLEIIMKKIAKNQDRLMKYRTFGIIGYKIIP